MPDGRILRQVIGIPMGDSISPGVTIGTCAWMEKEWLETISTEEKKNFRGVRYMDDILLMVKKNPDWDTEKFLEDFKKSTCYWDPLKLEASKEGIFLETQFRKLEGEKLQYRLKNDNEKERTVWRYHHYLDNGNIWTKRATLMATLRKVHKMASDDKQLFISGTAKIKEFREIGYPPGVLRYMCAIMAKEESCMTWREIRNSQT